MEIENSWKLVKVKSHVCHELSQWNVSFEPSFISFEGTKAQRVTLKYVWRTEQTMIDSCYAFHKFQQHKSPYVLKTSSYSQTKTMNEWTLAQDLNSNQKL